MAPGSGDWENAGLTCSGPMCPGVRGLHGPSFATLCWTKPCATRWPLAHWAINNPKQPLNNLLNNPFAHTPRIWYPVAAAFLRPVLAKASPYCLRPFWSTYAGANAISLAEILHSLLDSASVRGYVPCKSNCQINCPNAYAPSPACIWQAWVADPPVPPIMIPGQLLRPSQGIQGSQEIPEDTTANIFQTYFYNLYWCACFSSKNNKKSNILSIFRPGPKHALNNACQTCLNDPLKQGQPPQLFPKIKQINRSIFGPSCFTEQSHCGFKESRCALKECHMSHFLFILVENWKSGIQGRLNQRN